jgi:hypothetical protein
MEFRKWVVPTIVGISSFAAGIGVGLGFAKRQQMKIRANGETSKIEEVESQITQLSFMFEETDRRFDSLIQQGNRVVREMKEHAQTFAEKYMEEVTASRDEHPSSLPTRLEVVGDNIFEARVNDDWDWEEELANRSPNAPYILHREEFFANEMELEQTTITYYKGDDVLCDEKDVPIYSPEKVVGRLEFGRGSQDPNVVYIRNEELGAEWEVLLDHGYYAVEVLGGQIEDSMKDIKHSIRKFKLD